MSKKNKVNKTINKPEINPEIEELLNILGDDLSSRPKTSIEDPMFLKYAEAVYSELKDVNDWGAAEFVAAYAGITYLEVMMYVIQLSIQYNELEEHVGKSMIDELGSKKSIAKYTSDYLKFTGHENVDSDRHNNRIEYNVNKDDGRPVKFKLTIPTYEYSTIEHKIVGKNLANMVTIQDNAGIRSKEQRDRNNAASVLNKANINFKIMDDNYIQSETFER